MKTLYIVSSWIYGSFNNCKQGWQYDFHWEHNTPDVLNIIDRQLDALLKKKETVDKNLVEMHVIITKESYNDGNLSSSPDSVETLFSTLERS